MRSTTYGDDRKFQRRPYASFGPRTGRELLNNHPDEANASRTARSPRASQTTNAR